MVFRLPFLIRQAEKLIHFQSIIYSLIVMNSPLSVFRQKKEQLMQVYQKNKRVRLFFASYQQLLENTLRALWQKDFADEKIALLAIGGFGRQEVFPFSDTDIAIVYANTLHSEWQQKIEKFIQTLWDIGVYPSVKTGNIDELCQSAMQDMTCDTAFLEMLLIDGDRQIYDDFSQKIQQQRDIVSFVEGKIIEQENRHIKVFNSSSLLEPNIKTCPGGLRDIHTLRWLTKVQGLSPDFSSLVKQKILTFPESKLLIKSYNTLSRIRMELHLCAKRPEERLLFDYQNKIAHQMGYQDDAQSLKSEKLMKRLYRSIKIIKQLNGILLPMLKNRVHPIDERHIYPIDDDYYQIGEQIAVHHLQLFRQDNTHIFRILKHLQENQDITGIEPKTLRAWWQESCRINRNFYHNPINRQHFVQFFRYKTGLTHLLRFMNLYGILGQYLPNFGRIIGLLQHDLFHVYPVDDHILNVVRNLRRMAIKEHHHELPLASSLIGEYPHQDILYLAAFFHDIAKGRGGQHEILGVQDALDFAQDHFLNPHETELLTWLVEHHLFFSSTAQKEDIDQPEIIEKFCQTVNTKEKLIGLYLLTIADIRGTNPAIWSQWKSGLFEHLFQAAMSYLQGTYSDQSTLFDERRKTAIQLFNQKNIPIEKQHKIWHLLGEAYFTRHESDQIQWHLNEIAENPNTSHMAVRLYDNTIIQVMIYVPNTPRLFANICHIFQHLMLDIVYARAYLTTHQFILDTFELQIPEQWKKEDVERHMQRLKRHLNQFISKGNMISTAVTPTRSRLARHLPILPKITINKDENDDKEIYFILEIVTFNRRGLLAQIATILSDFNINIIHAHINTLGERVEDSFLIEAPMLNDSNQQIQLKKQLLSVIEA